MGKGKIRVVLFHRFLSILVSLWMSLGFFWFISLYFQFCLIHTLGPITNFCHKNLCSLRSKKSKIPPWVPQKVINWMDMKTRGALQNGIRAKGRGLNPTRSFSSFRQIYIANCFLGINKYDIYYPQSLKSKAHILFISQRSMIIHSY